MRKTKGAKTEGREWSGVEWSILDEREKKNIPMEESRSTYDKDGPAKDDSQDHEKDKRMRGMRGEADEARKRREKWSARCRSS